ncbi:peptidoglycan-binding protein [Clostridium beijerinckii]|nr:peptidoglycan-binding protein [Clostridium beijerinckii]MRY42931.1 glycoside hydrolase family protein [Parabacteroides distasonis]MZK52137.1 glycoside hydrolase family protein [Clostridium beijerinckii]MZK61701.1 glycoside hydrolase family protein [Clostridium beijerinckii]MZK71485.1 glycoside hydrolase family protein [Clostridium beijerinckii]MZK76844.1 glycoside hydrolase family protein [Clostridium beijerinckii]
MLLKNGSTNYEVKIIQNNLKMLGFGPISIDGIFGLETEAAVKKYQTYYDLSIDGIVGDITWSKFLSEIKYIQTALNAHGYNLTADGAAGPNTYNALIEFQRANSLADDGIVGPETRAALFKDNSSSCSMNYNISPKGISFIADYESFYSKPYRGLDSQNQTIGYGHVITSGENFESLTEAEAKSLLKKDLQSFVDSVNTMISGLNINQCQFDALVSFAYNCGANALKYSTLLKDIKANSNIEKIKEDFLMWCNCNGKRALGLYRRRYDEFEMYSNTDYTRTYREF